MLKSLAAPDPKKMMSFFVENMSTTIKRAVAFANLLPGFTDSFRSSSVLYRVTNGLQTRAVVID